MKQLGRKETPALLRSEIGLPSGLADKTWVTTIESP